MFLLFTLCISLIDTLVLEGRYERMECSGDVIYLAPAIGTSISMWHDGAHEAISLTDEPNYRIRSFRVTPFALYINRGTAIEKYYLASGIREIIHTGRDITAFDVTQTEDIILADRYERRLLFLDPDLRTRQTVEDIVVKDLRWHNGHLHALVRNGIETYDEHGNRMDRIALPERCDRIAPCGDKLLAFREKTTYAFEVDPERHKREYPFTIQDFCMKDDSAVVLDGAGSTLYIVDHDSL